MHWVRIFLCSSFSGGDGGGVLHHLPHADFLWRVNSWNARSLNKGTQGHRRALLECARTCMRQNLSEVLRPGRPDIEDEDRIQPRFGWQKLTAESLQLDFRENVLMPSLPVEKRALLRSQSGPFSSTRFVAFPTTKATTFDPQPFRVLMLRRVHLPLPLSIRNWRPLDSLGHHHAACAVAGVLGRRGFPLESAAARVCWEAGARVRTNVMVRDLDLWPPHRIDNHRLEVVADGLPLHGGAQLAIDTRLVSALTRDGTDRQWRGPYRGHAMERAHIPRIVW